MTYAINENAYEKEENFMPRPRKCRRVCSMPRYNEFTPTQAGGVRKEVVLTVDEYETIRLIDKENFSQEECSAYMNVARTTVQLIYAEARKKIAEAIVDGSTLVIRGGDFHLCEEESSVCCRGQRMHRCYRQEKRKKEESGMKIAIPLDENKKDVCVSFARAPYFMVCDGNEGAVEIIENPAAEAEGGAGLKAAQFVLDSGADTVITVRCGENAGNVFKAAEIKVYKSQVEDARENVKLLKEQKLSELTKFHAGFHGIQ